MVDKVGCTPLGEPVVLILVLVAIVVTGATAASLLRVP